MKGIIFRREYIQRIIGKNAFIITPKDRYSRLLSENLNFSYLLIFNDDIKFIIHPSQDDGSLSKENVVITTDPAGKVKEIIGDKKLFSCERIEELKTEFINVDNIFRKPYKDEIKIIKEGYELLDEAFGSALKKIFIGMKEYEIRAEFEYELIKRGFDGFVYPSVVLSGERSSSPISFTSNNVFKENDVLQIDLSPIYRGFGLHMARVLFSSLTDEIENAWRIYNKSFNIIEDLLKPGTPSSRIDERIRSYLSEKGFQYLHYTGFPLYNFSKPYIHPDSEDSLERDMIFVISPGLYVKNKYGFRVKRTVRITDHSFETLDKFGTE